MKRLLLVFLATVVVPCVVALVWCIAFPPTPPTAEEKQAAAMERLQPGVYYKIPGGGFSQLPPISWDPPAPPKKEGKPALQINNRRPVFYVKQAPLPDTMAALRGFQDARAWNIVRFAKSGISDRGVPRIFRTPISTTSFYITAAGDLPPGDYLIINMIEVGFDFAVR